MFQPINLYTKVALSLSATNLFTSLVNLSIYTSKVYIDFQFKGPVCEASSNIVIYYTSKDKYDEITNKLFNISLCKSMKCRCTVPERIHNMDISVITKY